MNSKISFTEITDKNLLEIIRLGINKKHNYINYYNEVLKNTPEDLNKIVREIIADEIKNKYILMDIYYNTCKSNIKLEEEELYVSSDFNISCKKAYVDKMESIEIYSGLYRLIKGGLVKDIIFDIILDEQLHIAKLNYCLMKGI